MLALPDESRQGMASGDRSASLRPAVLWGVVVGGLQAASPFGFWWLPPATVYALELALIASIYIGFSVADGRWSVVAVECTVAAAFVIVAAAGVTGPAWLLVAGLAGHGLKDLWQYRTQYVANTRWWPPFCASVDVVVAALLAVAILAGAHLHG
ncbi:MAG: hypothetical protein ACXVEU_05110 [Nocardioidaceae bacterium]